MRRREFIRLLGGTAAAWSLTAHAQLPAMPVVGYLHPAVPEGSAQTLAAFRKGLSETDFIEGQSVLIEYRWAHNDNGRLPELAADLVRHRVAVIAMPSSAATAIAAKAATTTIPIVFSTGADPVVLGLVSSLNRPGGNMTGIVTMNLELGAKRLGLLQQLLPQAERFIVLVNPTSRGAEPFTRNLRAAAATISQQIEVLPTRRNSGSALHYTSDVFRSSVCRSWWINELWNKLDRNFSPDRNLYRPHPQG